MTDISETSNTPGPETQGNRRPSRPKRPLAGSTENYTNLLIGLGKIAGVGGIALGVFVVLFRQLILQKVFPEHLPANQGYNLLLLFMLFTFGVAISGLAVWAARSESGRHLALILLVFAIVMSGLGAWLIMHQKVEPVTQPTPQKATRNPADTPQAATNTGQVIDGAIARAPQPALTEGYARLVGGIEVPIFIQILTAGGAMLNDNSARIGRDDGAPQPQWLKANNVKGYKGEISQSLGSFWQQSPFKDAKPLFTPLWKEFAEDPMSGMRLIFQMRGNKTQDLACLIHIGAPWLLDRRGEDHKRTVSSYAVYWFFHNSTRPPLQRPLEYTVTADEVPLSCTDQITKTVGFLFLVLENTSPDAVSELQIDYKDMPPNELSIHLLDDLEKVHATSIDETQILGQKIEYEHMLDAQRTITKFGPFLKPHQQLIWLISVYRTTSDDYEAEFLRSWSLPLRATYKVNGRPQSQVIRLPHRRNAIPIALPFGWYQQ